MYVVLLYWPAGALVVAPILLSERFPPTAPARGFSTASETALHREDSKEAHHVAFHFAEMHVLSFHQVIENLIVIGHRSDIGGFNIPLIVE